jgi:hypothetical protein
VKITIVPSQTGFADPVIETLTGSPVPAIMVIEFDVAGLLQMQAWFDVTSHLITSPFAGI